MRRKRYLCLPALCSLVVWQGHIKDVCIGGVSCMLISVLCQTYNVVVKLQAFPATEKSDLINPLILR